MGVRVLQMQAPRSVVLGDICISLSAGHKLEFSHAIVPGGGKYGFLGMRSIVNC